MLDLFKRIHFVINTRIKKVLSEKVVDNLMTT